MNCFKCQQPFARLLYIYECGHITCECYPCQNNCACGLPSPSVKFGRVDSRIVELLQDEDPAAMVLLYWSGSKPVEDALKRSRKRVYELTSKYAQLETDCQDLLYQRNEAEQRRVTEACNRNNLVDEYKKLAKEFKRVRQERDAMQEKLNAEARKTAEERMMERKSRRDDELRKAVLDARLAKAAQGRLAAELEDTKRDLARKSERVNFLIECGNKLTARVEELEQKPELLLKEVRKDLDAIVKDLESS